MKKGFILGIIIGGIIFGSSVFAISNYLYSSNEVSYTPSDTTWNVSDVKDALNDLHDKVKNYIPAPSGNKQITISSTGTSSAVDVTNYATATCKTSGLYSSCSSCCSTSNTPSRTLLWSNPNPTSAYASSPTDLTISYGTSNYDSIMIKFRLHTSSSTDNYNKFIYLLIPLGTNNYKSGVSFNDGTYWYMRPVNIKSSSSTSTTITFFRDLWVGENWGYSADRNVPIEIYGIKNMAL